MLFVLALGWSSCEGDADTSGPAIELTSPEAGTEFLPGTNIVLRLKFRDDSGLGIYKIEVFSNDSDAERFHFEREYEMEGVMNYYEIAHTVSIPQRGTTGRSLDTADYIIRITSEDILKNKTVLERNIRVIAQ